MTRWRTTIPSGESIVVSVDGDAPDLVDIIERAARNAGVQLVRSAGVMPLRPGPFQTSVVRRGLDQLLAFYPHLDVLSVDWQTDDGDWAAPWVLVVLGQQSEGPTPSWARWHFAIWRTTGAVHVMNDGAVSDDPLFQP